MKKRGIITFVFDDGYQKVYDELLPVLRKYNIHAVFAVPLAPENGVVSGEAIASLDAWRTAAMQGHELAGHGVTHRNLTTLSDEELERELAEPARVLSATTLIYPGGAHDERVMMRAKKYYSAARGVTRGFETIPSRKPFEMKTVNFTKRNFSVWKANIHALRACVMNTWLIETYHMVSASPSSLTHSALLSDFESHVKFVTKLPITVQTIHEAGTL